jgi:hypothetical protein
VREAFAVVLAVAYGFAAGTKRRQIHAFVSYLRPVAGRHAPAAARVVLLAEAVLVALCLAALAGGSVAVTAGAASAAFLVVATTVYASLIVRGESSQCQCFGIRHSGLSEDQALSPAAAAFLGLRNTILLVASLWVAGLPGLVSIESAAAIPLLIAAGLTASICIERRRLGHLDSPRVQRAAEQVGRLQAQSWWLDGEPRPL